MKANSWLSEAVAQPLHALTPVVVGWCLLLSACSGAQENFEGTYVRVCPPGSAMAGLNVKNNKFTCVPVAPTQSAGQIHTRLDKGTERDFGYGDMHICPAGWYMRGHDRGKNWLVCSDGPAVEESVLDAHGATQANGMHACPESAGHSGVMTGIHAGRDDFACARVR